MDGPWVVHLPFYAGFNTRYAEEDGGKKSDWDCQDKINKLDSRKYCRELAK